MICKIDNCDAKVLARGWCQKHYLKWWKHGDPNTGFELHGLTDTPEHNVWGHMRQRCHNTKNKSYKDYGGRGITICDRWRISFQSFYQDMGPRPSADHQIDRIDNDGNYEPSNCRWATRETQLNNYRRNRFITIEGRTQSLKRWVDEFGLNYSTVHRRLQLGWSNERALELKKG